MTLLENAAGLLRETERKLREILSEAAKSGDYPSVLQIASWAQAVTALANGRGARAVRGNGRHVLQKSISAANKRSIQTRNSRRTAAEYPQFFRNNDQLVRLAWSRGQKKEYIHKAPYAVLKLLAKAMVDRGNDGRVFSTDDFLPLQEKTSGETVPNYQAYVGISLLKQSGLIDQHGRQGYSIPRLPEFENAVETIWGRLPERH